MDLNRNAIKVVLGKLAEAGVDLVEHRVNGVQFQKGFFRLFLLMFLAEPGKVFSRIGIFKELFPGEDNGALKVRRIDTYVCRANELLFTSDLPYRIVSVRNEGYTLERRKAKGVERVASNKGLGTEAA